MTVVNIETGEIVDESTSINYEIHPVAALFPFMTGEPFREFVEDIRANGQRVPVMLDRDGRLIDGRNRARACQALGIDVIEERYEGRDVEAWIISHNVHRRHLTTSQRSMVAARLATLKHGSNQFAPREEGSFEPSSSEAAKTERSAPSIVEAAGQLNVARESVKRARAVIESGDTDLIQKVESGEVTVSAAAQQVKARSEGGSLETRDDRARKIGELAAEGYRSGQIAPRVGLSEQSVRQIARDYGIRISADEVTRKGRRVDSNRVLSGTAEALSAAAFSLQQVNPLDLDREGAQEWVDSLTESLSAIRKAVNSIKESLHG